VNGNVLDLSWPADHTGWTLQTNAVSLVNTSAWFAFPNSSTTNRVLITIDPARNNLFFRLRYP
jgi:hypothetical protein